MHDVADTLLHDVQTLRGAAMRGEGISPSVDALLVGDQLVANLGSTRGLYDDFLKLARTGTADTGTLANEMDFIAGNLRATGEVRDVPGQVIGHVRSAKVAADEVVANLRRGIGPEDGTTHTAMWRLRNELDEGWQQLGIAKVMGNLRGITSAT
jgi:hypothetical protein